MSPPDVARRPPLPKKTKDDESSSRHSSTSGKSRSSGGTRTDRQNKSPRRELDGAFLAESTVFQCSILGCGNQTANSRPGFCTMHLPPTGTAEGNQNKILFMHPANGRQEEMLAFHFGKARQAFIDTISGGAFLSET